MFGDPPVGTRSEGEEGTLFAATTLGVDSGTEGGIATAEVAGGAGVRGGDPRVRRVLDPVYPIMARYRQPLSRLGLHKVVGAMMRAVARIAPGRY